MVMSLCLALDLTDCNVKKKGPILCKGLNYELNTKRHKSRNNITGVLCLSLTHALYVSSELILKFATIRIAVKISTNILKKLSLTLPKHGGNTRVGPKVISQLL